MANATGIIYAPPQPGFPHLAAVFLAGRLLHCEAVDSAVEGQAILARILEKMPEMIQDAQNDQDEADERLAKRTKQRRDH